MRLQRGRGSNTSQGPVFEPRWGLFFVLFSSRARRPSQHSRIADWEPWARGPELPTGDARALLVVLDHEVRRDVRAVRAEARERREDDAVAELEIAHVGGLEELWGRG